MAAVFYPVGLRPAVKVADQSVQQIAQIGHMVSFFVRTIASIPLMLRRYPREFFRLLSDVTWGNGSVVVGGAPPGWCCSTAPPAVRSSPSRATTR